MHHVLSHLLRHVVDYINIQAIVTVVYVYACSENCKQLLAFGLLKKWRVSW